MLERYARILETCEPYLIVAQMNADGVQRSPLGVSIPDSNIADPQRVSSAGFLGRLQRLNDLTYAPRGLQMPRWAFYDCAEMSGCYFGFGRRAHTLPHWVRDALASPDRPDALVPLSIVVLVPMLPDGAYLSFTMCSVNQVCPGAAPAGIRTLSRALALSVFPVRRLYGTTQWRSSSLEAHAAVGRLRILSAFTPAHSLPATLTYATEIDDDAVARALGEKSLGVSADRWVDADDHDALHELQREIEAGATWDVVGGPVRDGAIVRVPLARGLALAGGPAS